MTCFIGIDSSTTATKALLMDEVGTVIAVASSEYAFETPRPQWSEQAPALWWDATIKSIRGVLVKAGVGGAAVSGLGLKIMVHRGRGREPVAAGRLPLYSTAIPSCSDTRSCETPVSASPSR